MKSIKQIALVTFLTLGVFCAALYSSSCSKDNCKATTCLYKGTCSGGICTCIDTGLGGANCEIVYRALYSNTYYGVESDNLGNRSDNNTLIFSSGNDSLYSTMQVEWDDTTASVVKLPIVLSNNSAAGSNFTITDLAIDTVTYSGTGTVSKNSASLNLIERHKYSPSVYISLNNFNRK